MNNLIITGIPRSSTTLVTALVDGFNNTVALNEPLWQATWPLDHPNSTAKAYVTFLREDFLRLRNEILAGHPIIDLRKHTADSTTDYHRGEKVAHVPVDFSARRLTSDFRLAIKHNAAYLAVLDELVEAGDFKILVVIRHPIDVLYSWSTLDLPVSRGQLPHGIPYWKKMRDITQSDTDLLRKQALMYDAMCEKIARNYAHVLVLRHELIATHPWLVEHLLCGGSSTPTQSLVRDNPRKAPDAFAESIRTIFRQECNSYTLFYDVNL